MYMLQQQQVQQHQAQQAYVDTRAMRGGCLFEFLASYASYSYVSAQGALAVRLWQKVR